MKNSITIRLFLKKLSLSLLSYIVIFTLYANNDTINHKFLEIKNLNSTTINFGIEYAELTQNKFRNLGQDNFTFYIGQQLGGIGNGKSGWRYMIINVELSPEHIQNTNQVGWIEGNRTNLNGTVHAQRLSYDYYPITIRIEYVEKWERHVLTVNPVLYADLGYNSWFFNNTAYNELYKLNAFTFGGGFRLQSILFDFLIIENPLFDFFTYISKSRSTMGTIGDTKIIRPEHIGLFSWATIGFKFNLN